MESISFLKVILIFSVLSNLYIGIGSHLRPKTRNYPQRYKRAFDNIMGSSGNWKMSKKEIKKMFEEYYECITEMNEEAANDEEDIKAILALEGQRVELKCRVCIRPGRESKLKVNFWQVVQTADATLKIIRKRTKGMKVLKDMTLLIDRIDVKDAGQYFCVSGEDAVIIYQVDVLFREPQKTVSENDTDSLQPARKLVDHNLEVFSHWSEWSDCDQCGKDGKRMKFGTCMVKKTIMERPITPVDIPIMSLYKDGVPCRSTVLTREVAHLNGIHGRQSEVIQGVCNVPCPSTPKPIEVTDANGKVIDIIEAGFQPLHEKPEVPPMVIRQVLYKASGIYLTLSCPTSQTGKVRWQRGERPINTATIRKQTRGRVFVDRLNRLIIRRLHLKDTAPYSCFVWQRHVATLKVIVYEAMNDDIKHFITYGGIFLTVFVLLTYCTCKLCFGKKKRARR